MKTRAAWIGGVLVGLLLVVALWFAWRSRAPVEVPTPPPATAAPAAAPAPAPEPPAPALPPAETTPAPVPPPAPVPEDPPPEGDVHLEVLVKDAEGAPVEGAVVHLFRMQAFGPGAPFPGGTETAPRKTDGTGTVVLGIGPKDLGKARPLARGEGAPEDDEVPGELMLYAVKGATAALLGELDLPEFGKVRREMIMGAAGALEGTVRRHGGELVAGADLELSLNGPDEFSADLRTTSDAEGRFRFPPIPLRHHDQLTWLIVNAPGAMERQMKPGPGHFRGSPLGVILDPLWRLRGRCVGADGKPLAGIPASAPPGSTEEDGNKWRTVTGPDGRFVIESLPEDCIDLHVGAEGGVHKVVARIRSRGRDEVDLGELTIGEGMPLRGVVLRENGEAVAGALVLLNSGLGPGDFVAKTRTDGQGRFSFSVGDGTYSVSVHTGAAAELGEEEVQFLAMTDEDAATRDRLRPGPEEVRIFLGGLRARFRFLDTATREPARLTRARVELYPVGGSTGSEDAWSTGSGKDQPEPIEILITTRKAGTYEFRASAEGHEVEHPPTVLVLEEREAIVDVLVRKP